MPIRTNYDPASITPQVLSDGSTVYSVWVLDGADHQAEFNAVDAAHAIRLRDELNHCAGWTIS